MDDGRTLAERLGHAADARIVIISCDDLGSCHGATEGVFRAVREGIATSLLPLIYIQNCTSFLCFFQAW